MHKNFYEVEVGIHLTDDNEENANITIDDNTLKILLESYESRLDDTDECHTHLLNTLREFEIIE